MQPINWFGTPLVRPTISHHMIAPYLYTDIEAAIIQSRPSALKIVADGGEFAMFSNYYNNLKDWTIFLARPYTPGEVIAQAYNQGTDPVLAAQAWHNAVQQLVPMLPGAYWGGWNEPAPGSEDWLDRCEAERIRLAAANGYRVTVLEWSEGNPQVPPWDTTNSYNMTRRTLDAIEAAGPGVALLAPHEYLRYGTDMLSQPYRIGRINDVLSWARGQGYTNLFAVVGEYGIDPWQGVLNAEQYAYQLTREDVHDYYDANVLAMTTFTLDYSPGWQSFNYYGGCFVAVNQYLTANRPSYVPPIPSGPIDPPPEPPPPSGVKTTTGNLYLRQGPGTEYKKLCIMPLGTIVNVIETSGNWAHVSVTLSGWLLTYEVPYSTYAVWDKILPTLDGWCSLSWLA